MRAATASARALAVALLLATACTSSHGRPAGTGQGTASSGPLAPTTRPGAVGVTTAPTAGRAMCGREATPPAVWAHVVWIWMENHDERHIVGNPEAPYGNHTLIAQCGLATNYHNVIHPSLPNYLAATSGRTLVGGDCGPDACATSAPSLFAQLRTAGKSWRAYQESMPSNCAHGDSGEYAARHNPPVYYTPIADDCARWDVPMGGDQGQLAGDLSSGHLPDFAFITPNLCDDTHDCGVRTGDRWLATWVPRIVASPAYRAGSTVVVLTWDEGDSGGSSDCARNTTEPGCQVATVVIAPTTRPGTRSDVLFNHYSLLATTEQLLGLPVALGHAADPSTASMRTAFNL